MDDEVDPVRHQGREAIAGLKAKPAVSTGQRGARPFELVPTERAVGRGDRDFVRGGLETDPQQITQRRGRGFKLVTLEQHSLDPTRAESRSLAKALGRAGAVSATYSVG